MENEVDVTNEIIDKFNEKEQYMQKDNALMVGYSGLHDLIHNMFGLKQPVLNMIFAGIATITTLITQYIYDDAKSVYFMLSLIILDAFTGIARSIKKKTFSSARLPRIFVIAFVYCTLLSLAWNVAKISPLYYWLPAMLFGGFISTLIVSIFENLHELKWIPDSLYAYVNEKLTLMQKFVFGKKFGKKK